MSAACAEKHIFQPSHQLSKKEPLKDIEIPPMKLLLSHSHIQENANVHLPYETSLHKYLPFNRNNHEDHDNDVDPYATKVRRCSRSRSHDWTDCPFAHPGEKARRRDPRHYHYSSTVCSDFRRGGSCPRRDDRDFAHGVFECWLHPARYRTEACKDGKNCKRKVCFFAHSSGELRLLPEASPKYKNSGSCILFCNSVTSSPASTLLGLSHLSPPLSLMKQRTSLSGFPPISGYSDRLSKFGTEMMRYKDVLEELMSCLENTNLCEVSLPMACGNYLSTPSLDVSFIGEDQQQFPSGSGDYFGAASKGSSGDDQKLNDNGVACDPDLDIVWVNDLLM